MSLTVRWLGPPDHEVHLHAHGNVKPGDVLELDDEKAAKLIRDGRAEAVKPEPKTVKEKTAKPNKEDRE